MQTILTEEIDINLYINLYIDNLPKLYGRNPGIN